MEDLVHSYLAFQNQAHSPFHVVATIKSLLLQSGFKQLFMEQPDWQIKTNQTYFVEHQDGKSIIIIKPGKSDPLKAGFRLFGAHTDSPVFKLKLNPYQLQEGYPTLKLQRHGGLIFRSWLDRPLILAGCVYRSHYKKKLSVEKKILHTNEPLGIIPDLAIHMDREKNKNGEINLETMISLVVGCKGNEDEIKTRVYDKLGVNPSKWDGFDLCLAPYFPHLVVADDFILGPRHDDLAMVFTGLKAIVDADQSQQTAVAAFFDAEEIGSRTCSGAQSSFLRDFLSLYCTYTNGSTTALPHALAQSFLVSADMAHGVHPCFPEKHSANHKPMLNGGIVIKENALGSYATTGYSSTFFRRICAEAKVPVQNFVPRQDTGCGGTIGPISAANLSCHTVDLGVSQWGMHSSAETMGTRDLAYAYQAFKAYFEIE